jgi:hypothetical protein
VLKDLRNVGSCAWGINLTTEPWLAKALPMQLPHPLIQQAKDRVANAVAKAGKWWVTCVGDHFALVRSLREPFHKVLILESARNGEAQGCVT